MSENNNLIQPMTIDQLAGAFALAMGAIGSVLLVMLSKSKLLLCF